MRRSLSAIVAVGVLVSGLGVTFAGATPTARYAQEEDGGTNDVYVGRLDGRDLAAVRATGLDMHEMDLSSAPDGQADVEVILSDDQAADLVEQGVDLELKEIDGQSVAELSTREAAAGYEVFRPYGGDGGLKEEYEQLAADNPDIAKLVTIGQTVNGQDIIAIKITRRANHTRDGRRPATLFSSAQHAREWITPEMIRRLAHYIVDGYGTDPTITNLVNRTELWFVPVANPDGYDFTFEPGQRLWRKNLRDNDGDGVITDADGVDPNRNYPTKWGYDNEGSSPELHQRDVPGRGPGVRARDAGPRRPARPRRLRVPHQLPLGRRAAALRHRLAGGDPDARRRRVRGDGRRRREPGHPDLRPRHLSRALHHQR